MFGKTGAFVSAAGGSVCPIQTGGHFGDLHAVGAENIQYILIHRLTDAFHPGISVGGIVAYLRDVAGNRIGDETAAELAEQQVQDWDYSWARAASPRFAEAVAALPPQARAAGAELAEAYSAQASLKALRDRKVNGIRQAQQHWQQRVDDAVQAGDAQRAEQWLESGAGVFVPHGELKQRKQEADSKACAARWMGALQADPVQALADFYSASTSTLPALESDRTLLAEQMQRQQAQERRALAQAFIAGNRPAEPELQRFR